MEKNVESSEATFGILMDVMGAPGSGEIRGIPRILWEETLVDGAAVRKIDGPGPIRNV